MLGIRSHISFEPISKAILWTWKQTQPKRSNPDEDITDRFHAIEIKDCPHRLKEVTTIMVYNFFFGNKQAQNTPQTQPIPGRESEMIRGKSGGYMFQAGIWRTLRRCLLIGTGNGSYYATKWELTDDFVDVLEKAIAENPDRVAQEIVYASDGRSIFWN